MSVVDGGSDRSVGLFKNRKPTVAWAIVGFSGNDGLLFLGKNLHDTLDPCPGPTAEDTGAGVPALHHLHHGNALGHCERGGTVCDPADDSQSLVWVYLLPFNASQSEGSSCRLVDPVPVPGWRPGAMMVASGHGVWLVSRVD